MCVYVDAKRLVFHRRQLEAKRRKVRNAVQYLEEGFDDDYDEEYGAERGVDMAWAMLVIHEGYRGLAVFVFSHRCMLVNSMSWALCCRLFILGGN
jgi:hypothetical protein